MAVRSSLASWLTRAVEQPVRGWIREAVAASEPRLAALEEENEKLKKKLSMATGAVQAASAELAKLKAAQDEGRNLASQAMQRATSALAAAEAAAEGVTELEAHAAAAAERAPVGVEAVEVAEAPSDPDLCSVPGCGKPHRAKGLCARHYQQRKRGTLA